MNLINKKSEKIIWTKVFVLCLFLFCNFFGIILSEGLYPGGQNRQRININREWKFTLGDFTGAEAESYNDREWSVINLPHNFSIPYFQSAHWYTGFGWYRKYIDVPAQWKSKRVFIEFEGAFREAQIYVNGNNLYTWTKLTKLMDPETKNASVYPMVWRSNMGLRLSF
jgi:hypothetical protein